MASRRGSIVVSTTYRPPLPWDIFSCPVPASDGVESMVEEVLLSDGVSYNHNCRPIPVAALKALVARKPELATACGATVDDVEKGRATGLVFVSERESCLETLHVALRCDGKVKVLSLADMYGTETFGGVRMEDSGCFGGGFAADADPCIVYVSTKTAVEKPRTPWTVVYRTNLRTGQTERLTPQGEYDLSPAVSPSGKRVAVANFRQNRWTGETEHLKTDLVVMNVDRGAQGGALDRKLYVQDGGWPSWGSDNVIFFHRGGADGGEIRWGVFRYDIAANRTDRVTPEDVDAMTPAAIDESRVAVATIRRQRHLAQRQQQHHHHYRHIEIFDFAATPYHHSSSAPVKVTQVVWPTTDYYSPFVLDGGRQIGYHRVRSDLLQELKGLIDNGSDFIRFHNGINKLQSPPSPHDKDDGGDVHLLRVGGYCSAVSGDGSKLAFVDNEFRAVLVADEQGLRVVYRTRRSGGVFSVAWNKNPYSDTLYVCVGPSFRDRSSVEICAITNVSSSSEDIQVFLLTDGGFNNAFPSSNPDGTKIVFRSTRGRGDHDHRHAKNLYIMEDARTGEYGGSEVTPLTAGDWTDTQCEWSPRGDWIVFSSSRDKPADYYNGGQLLDPGHFAVFLVSAREPDVVVRVITSGGHINHPVFSPDGRSIAFTSDLAAVSNEPISLPKFMHAVRPYGDIFSVDIDPVDIHRNRDIDKFHRLTHSRYEYCTHAWTAFSSSSDDTPSSASDGDNHHQYWNMMDGTGAARYNPACPYIFGDGSDSAHMTGHLVIDTRRC